MSYSRNSKALKIIIPILFVCIVIGIWAIKNYKKENNYIADKLGSNTTDKSKMKDNNNDFDLLVTEKINLKKLKSYGVPIVIDFGSDSCSACKEMFPVLKELNSKLRGKAIIKFVDVWKYDDLEDGYPVSLIPTQILIDAKGEPYTPKDSQTTEFKQYISKETDKHIFTAHEGGITKEELLSILKEMGLK